MANKFDIDTAASFETNFHNLLTQSTGSTYSLTDYRIMKFTPIVNSSKVKITIAGEILNETKGRNDFEYNRLNLAMYDGEFITVNSERCFHITDVFLLIDSSKVTREEVLERCIEEIEEYMLLGETGKMTLQYDKPEINKLYTNELLTIESFTGNDVDYWENNGEEFVFNYNIENKNPYWTLMENNTTVKKMKITATVVLNPPI